jgi:hypothetical protein
MCHCGWHDRRRVYSGRIIGRETGRGDGGSVATFPLIFVRRLAAFLQSRWGTDLPHMPRDDFIWEVKQTGPDGCLDG